MKKSTLRNLAGILMLLFATAVTSMAQIPAVISVSGNVNYLGTNLPAANKTVTILVDSGQSPVNPVVTLTTNAQGFFMDSISIADTSRNTMLIIYTTDCNNMMVQTIRFTNSGSHVNGIQLNICQTAQTINISGSVVDARTTTPMANQPVTIEADSSLWSRGFSFMAINATTDANGMFTATVPYPSTFTSASYVIKTMACGAIYSSRVTSTGSAVQTSISTCANISTTTSLVGAAYLGPNTLASNYYVAAFQIGSNYSNITYVNQGDFSFQNMPSGQYILVAWLSPTHPQYLSYFPTYGYSTTSWTTGTQFGPNSTLGIGISLINTDSAVGSGSVGGTVGGDSTLNATVRTAYTMPFLMSQARVIISDATTNRDRYFAQVNANGSYTLPNLPFGTYKIRLEYAKVTSPMGTITISPSAPAVSVNFNVTGGNVTTSIRRNMNNAALSVYPNPAQDVVTVNWQSAEIKSVKVITTLGSQVQAPVSLENGKAQISVAGLKAGIYTVIAEGQNGEFLSQTVVKQ